MQFEIAFYSNKSVARVSIRIDIQLPGHYCSANCNLNSNIFCHKAYTSDFSNKTATFDNVKSIWWNESICWYPLTYVPSNPIKSLSSVRGAANASPLPAFEPLIICHGLQPYFHQNSNPMFYIYVIPSSISRFLMLFPCLPCLE